MALHSIPASGVKLFSLARTSPVAGISAGRLLAASITGAQNRFASGG